VFGFCVTYLCGAVVAADIRTGNDKDQVEWPPHPDRLFSALVQAWGDLGRPEAGRDALLWLEHLPAPLIACGDLLTSRRVLQYVPVNDWWSPVTKKGKVAPPVAGTVVGRVRQPRRIAHATLSQDGVTIWWPDATPSAEHRAWLRALARAVASLGHPSSLVAVDLVDEAAAPDPAWLPDTDGAHALRVPAPGRLAELCEAFDAATRRRPPAGTWATYGRQHREPIVHHGHHRDLVVLRLVGDAPPLLLEAAGAVLAVWRKALLDRADQPVCEALSGHESGSTAEAPRPSRGPHLALLPLADVGHPYARSHLLGLGAALPDAISWEDRRACLRALGRVDHLTLGRWGVWRLVRCDPDERRRALLAETWSTPAQEWGSVTPLVFGKFPRTLWGDEAADLVAGACAIAGLPRPSRIALAPTSWILGVPPAQRFAALPSRPGKPRRLHAHVRLTFDEPVAGPVLVGAGRHQGYGLFRQLEEVP
jgi:CRISPR-associated protein Csb2